MSNYSESAMKIMKLESSKKRRINSLEIDLLHTVLNKICE